MVAFPPCKINLGLNILRKRADSYHDLETCFYPIPWTDILEVIPSDKFEFTVSGNTIPANDSGDSNENLCVKAYRLLNAPPARIHLHKIIPTGAGLGGGSSDAAWTLRLLNDVFGLKLGKNELRTIASQIGSDCAFFIDDEPMMGTGRGDALTPSKVSLKGKFIVIVKPDVHVSTAEAYAGIVPKAPYKPIAYVLDEIPIPDWQMYLKNDFEETVIDRYPIIGSAKERLHKAGAAYTSMTGSGSAVYGIFNDAVDAKALFPNSTVFSSWL